MTKTNFKDYWESLSENQQKELAKNAETSPAYLSQVASGHRNAGWATIQKLKGADSNIEYEMFEKAA